MLIYVRTTVIIEERLFRAAKRAAAIRGMTLSDLVCEALRGALASRSSPAPTEFRMTTYGRPAHGVQHEPRELAETIDDEEASRLRS
jgi:hypothetical protein